ncbi:UDP-2,3-diacylglucosamine diphosphatase LpxI [Acidobacteria bacterium AH-259-D05]|nr:UDP-2,3-diacylglucosamine diphosphatase LpxI [Acidobacteria bacterium AH-259-D05]
MTVVEIEKLGLIAGNGRFPFLVLEEALKRDIHVTVAAIRKETFPEIQDFATQPEVTVHWLGLGQLGKLIRLFKSEGVQKAIMAGQVKHVQIFSRKGSDSAGHGMILPDVKMIKVFMSLPHRNTQSLIGGVIGALEDEGIEFIDSTMLLESLLAEPGVLTRRKPGRRESKDIDYGRPIARQIARLDLGQTIVVKDQAVVAVEAMEGTNDTIRRASRLVKGGRLTVIKVSRPDQDMRFDVPVVGLDTLLVLKECNVSALAVDAGKSLILDREQFLREANRLKMAIVAD